MLSHGVVFCSLMVCLASLWRCGVLCVSRNAGGGLCCVLVWWYGVWKCGWMDVSCSSVSVSSFASCRSHVSGCCCSPLCTVRVGWWCIVTFCVWVMRFSLVEGKGGRHAVSVVCKVGLAKLLHAHGLDTWMHEFIWCAEPCGNPTKPPCGKTTTQMGFPGLFRYLRSCISPKSFQQYSSLKRTYTDTYIGIITSLGCVVFLWFLAVATCSFQSHKGTRSVVHVASLKSQRFVRILTTSSCVMRRWTWAFFTQASSGADSGRND